MSMSFKEQIKRNDLLDVYSNIMDTVYLRLLDSVKSLPFNTSKEAYCLLTINIGNIDSGVSVYINSQLIANFSMVGVQIIPIKIKPSDILKVSGSGSNIVIMLQGARFKHCTHSRLLPKNNKLVTYGENVSVYGVTSVDDLMSNTYQDTNDFGKVKFVQTYIENSEIYMGKIQINNGVYFSTSMDNYTLTSKILDIEPDDIIYLQDVSSEMLVFIYIVAGRVYSKRYSNSMVLDMAEQEIKICNGKNAVSLIASESYGESQKFWAILYDDNTIDVMFKRNYANVQKVAELIGNNLRIIEKSNRVALILKKDYSFDYYLNSYDSNESGSNVLSCLSGETIENIADCMQYNNKLICFGNGLSVWQKEITW